MSLRIGAFTGLCLFAGAVALWFYLAPSSLLKLVLRPPRLQKFQLAGGAASGTVIDLQGGWFNEGKPTEIVIRSRLVDGGWDAPERIVIRNGSLRGSIRIAGLGRNGEAPGVRESSLREGHTERAQAAAPREIVLQNLQIEADHRIPLYLGPGVTRVTVKDCTFRGWSVSTVVYLDAESADNTIENCTFTRTRRAKSSPSTGPREMCSVAIASIAPHSAGYTSIGTAARAERFVIKRRGKTA